MRDQSPADPGRGGDVKTNRHIHRAVEKLDKTWGWNCCVAANENCDGRPHGGVIHVSTCACGATRATESNGRYAARSEWITGANDQQD